MKKGFILILAGFIIAIVIVALWINSAIEDEKNKYKMYVGQKICINKDTTEIVDYSTLEENFILANGKTVSYQYVKKQKSK